MRLVTALFSAVTQLLRALAGALGWLLALALVPPVTLLLALVLVGSLTSCKQFPTDAERDPGTVVNVESYRDDSGESVTVNVRRWSDGRTYSVTGLAGTPCRAGDPWPECH